MNTPVVLDRIAAMHAPDNAMEAEANQPQQPARNGAIDWESFYRHYRKPGYVAGFEIVNKLGGGVFGLVFKARKESIGKDYAIKFLKVDEEEVRDAVVRELASVDLFAQIDHPNLVSIEDKGEIDGIPFIVMSYAGDETLRKRLDAGQLTRDEALRIFCQAARGVQALHEHSLVHFDLKPANIFLKGDIARVGDYGLSKLVTASRNSMSFGRGTPYYMAPEMLRRRGDVRSDIYSLGVVLYECLSGDVPFRGDSEWQVLNKHENEAPSFPDSIGARERHVIARCLAKDPEARYQSVSELLHDLQAPAALGESLVIPPRSAAPHVPPPIPAADSPPRAAGTRAAAPAGTPAAPPFGGALEHEPRRGPVGLAVHGVFRLLELAILALLVPLRTLSVALGRTLVFLLQLPFRILAVVLSLASYMVVAAALLMLLAGVFTLVFG